MRNWIFIFSFLFFINSGIAQRNVKDSIIGTPWVGVQYGSIYTGGDLADRYPFFNHVGILAGYKTNKNWFWGMDANFMFGNKVLFVDSLFQGLTDSSGNITDVNGDIAKVLVLSRGLNVNLTVGKVFPVLSPNKNSGIFVHGGVGYLLHHARIETQDQVVPQIELEYKKGYDRLTIGPNIHEFIGYAFMANSGYLNFYGGFYFQQGFTKNQRTIFFDKPNVPVSQEVRLDLQFGLKLGWFIPFYKRQPKDFYFD